MFKFKIWVTKIQIQEGVEFGAGISWKYWGIGELRAFVTLGSWQFTLHYKKLEE